MESKIFHGENKIVERELNDFLRSGSMTIKNIEMSSCKAGSSMAPTMVTVLVLYERKRQNEE